MRVKAITYSPTQVSTKEVMTMRPLCHTHPFHIPVRPSTLFSPPEGRTNAPMVLAHQKLPSGQKSTMVKQVLHTALRVGCLIIGAALMHTSSAQHRFPTIRLQASTDVPMTQQEGIYNLMFTLRTGQLGLSLALDYAYAESPLSLHQMEFQRTGTTLFVGGYVGIHNGIRRKNKGPGMIACPTWGDKEKQRRSAQLKALRGELYGHLGWHRGTWDMALRPYSPGNGYHTRTARILNNGVCLRGGYAIRWWLLFAEVGYTATLTFPKADDPFGMVDETIYTGQRPFAYRLYTAPDLRAGLTIPLNTK